MYFCSSRAVLKGLWCGQCLSAFTSKTRMMSWQCWVKHWFVTLGANVKSKLLSVWGRWYSAAIVSFALLLAPHQITTKPIAIWPTLNFVDFRNNVVKYYSLLQVWVKYIILTSGPKVTRIILVKVTIRCCWTTSDVALFQCRWPFRASCVKLQAPQSPLHSVSICKWSSSSENAPLFEYNCSQGLLIPICIMLIARLPRRRPARHQDTKHRITETQKKDQDS